MNLVYDHPCIPLRVLIVNPVADTGVMLCIKVLRGVTFGLYQMVDLILLVYANEVEQAQRLKWELDSSGFPCNNGITITSDLPSITDADVFIVISDFPSLNSMDFTKINEDDNFDSLYLLLKIANNLEMLPPPEKPDVEPLTNIRRNKSKEAKQRRPVIIADGLIALDILKTFSKNLPNDIFFCPTPISGTAKTVLAEKLDVFCHELNHVYIWAANNEVFHVDVGVPLYLPEKSNKREHCEWEAMADTEYEHFEIDSTQFNAAWLKKDYIQKLKTLCQNQQIGSIYKSSKMARTIESLWKTRSLDPQPSHKVNLGIISDGSLETYEGLPYFLPIILEGETYKINNYLEEDYHLKRELKIINKAVQAHHRKLIPYCRNFLEKNVLNLEFMPQPDESSSRSGQFSVSTSIESAHIPAN